MLGAIVWLSVLTAWWTGLKVGFDRAIAKTMGPLETKLFVPCIWTGIGLLALTFVAAMLRLFSGDPVLAIGLLALLVWRWMAMPPVEQ